MARPAGSDRARRAADPYRWSLAGLVALWIAAALASGSGRIAAAGGRALQATGANQTEAAAQRALLDRYCIACHNARQKAQGTTPISLDDLDLSNVPRARRAVGKGHFVFPGTSALLTA